MRMRTARQFCYRSPPLLTALRLLLAVGTFVHCAVEGLVDCLVLWLVTNTSLPAPGFAFGLIASAHKASVTPSIGLLVRAVFTFPETYEAHLIYKSYCGMDNSSRWHTWWWHSTHCWHTRWWHSTHFGTPGDDTVHTVVFVTCRLYSEQEFQILRFLNRAVWYNYVIRTKHILPSTRLLIWMHERNSIKLRE